jgi:lipopolysaccharide/colanic/teichoic acid biosynthesis glycosyltransferase
MKRLLDTTLATRLLLLASPLSIIAAIGIRMDSPGRIIISTARMGKHGEILSHYRFRAMAEEPLQKTRFDRLMGNISIDDIPTLWNVPKGDMSMVSPGTEIPEKVDLSDPDWQTISSTRSGMIGLGGLTFREMYIQTEAKRRI